MRYLFFDIECCNGRNMCEFGYVITDEKFNVLLQHNITINPERKFDLTGRVDQRDLHLHYPNAVYYSSPTFSTFYDEIKKLIEAPNQIIVGHSISNDAKFLRTACKRYSLEFIDFKFYDSQKMFSEYFNEPKCISLEEAGEILKAEKLEHLHKSDEDSLLTMRVVQKMCEEMEITLPKLIELCPSCSGKSLKGAIEYDDAELKEEERNCIVKKNSKLFRVFIDNVRPQGTVKQSPLTGKAICVSHNYEHYHFKEMLALIQLIVNCGGQYSMKASSGNLYVKYDSTGESDNERFYDRLKYVEQANADGAAIEIIEFKKLLELLDTTEQALWDMPFPEENAFISKNDKKSKPIQHIESKSFTLGDILKSQNIDLRKVI